jgi:exopolysaccharide biosynthesis polyprenyl glycosylphosphotransferase
LFLRFALLVEPFAELSRTETEEPFSQGLTMIIPEYLEQVVISNRRRRRQAKPGVRHGAAFGETPITTVIWAAMDYLSVIVAGLIAFRIWLTPQADPIASGVILRHLEETAPLPSIICLLVFAAYLVFFAQIFGVYRPSDTRSGLNEQRMTLQATLTAALMLCGTLFVLRVNSVSRLVIAMTLCLTLAMIMPRRAIWRKLRERRFLKGLNTRNVLIVGDGRVGHALRNHLEALPHMGFRFKGFVTLDPQDTERENVIGDVRNCVAMARSLFVDEIYFSTPAEKQTVLSVVDEARAIGIEVRVVPDLYDGLAWNAPVEFVGQFPTIPLHRRDFPRGAFMVKRVMDILLSLAGVIALTPVLLTIALLVKLDSTGPIFYRAGRIGRKGRVFTCYKFRTMVADAEQIQFKLAHLNERKGLLFKISNDPRMTRLGARLRKYSLDELPQLFNVLRGDMSLVGPRPPLASEVEQYKLDHLRRLDVLPGMTGLWQVEARQDPSFDSYISLDTAYVDNWNLMLDMRILARTVGVVFAGTGT